MPLGGFQNTALPMIDNSNLIEEFDKTVENLLEFEVAGRLVTAACERKEAVDPYE